MDRSGRVTTVLRHAKSLLAADRSRMPGGGKHVDRNHGARRLSSGKRVGAALGRKPAAVLAGTALALAGAGSASAATAGAFSAGAPGPTGKITKALASTRPLSGSPLNAGPLNGAAGGGQGHSLLAGHAAASKPAPLTWVQIRNKINQETFPAKELHRNLPFAGRLLPLGTSGPQAWMPLSKAQVHNATTIVRRAFAKKMGIRSAVIAVATSMQESRLLNIDYGDANSLGLFQQQTGMGWGTARQIMRPAFAADAFLDALAQYQAQDHLWARQPLWANAQAVQRSGFPFAYARWELQAAGLVKQIATQMMSSPT
jgi:hypothetical protein